MQEGEYLQVSCHFRVEQGGFDVVEKERRNSFSESFKIMRLDSSHHKVNFSVNQFENFLGQFTFVFLYKTQKCSV